MVGAARDKNPAGCLPAGLIMMSSRALGSGCSSTDPKIGLEHQGPATRTGRGPGASRLRERGLPVVLREGVELDVGFHGKTEPTAVRIVP